MSLVISNNFVLSAPEAALSLDHPVIGWDNVVRADSIIVSAESEPNFPKTNLANPATHLEWQSAEIEAQQLLFGTNRVEPVDYIAVARHNWASAEIPVSVEALIDGDWVEIVQQVMLPDDGPALFRFNELSTTYVRFNLLEGSAAPRAAVVNVGKLLVIERKIWVGHTPLPHGRKRVIATGRSESGNFLGRIMLGESRESTVPLSLISPDWYRAIMDPFLAAAGEDTFFFAWRSQTYPREVGYCWLMDDPQPVPAGPSNLLTFDLKLGGVA
jgi:hypothetical protein